MKKTSVFLIALFVGFNLQILGQIISPTLFVNGKSGTRMTKFKDSLFYIDHSSHNLYKTNGITTPVLVKLLPALYYRGDYAANDSVFCFAMHDGGGNRQVWKTNGSTVSTIALKTSTDWNNGKFIVSAMDTLFFSGGDSIYTIKKDGSKKGILPSNLTTIYDMFAYGDNLCVSKYAYTGAVPEGLYAYNVQTKATTTIMPFPSFDHIIHNDSLYVSATNQQYLFEIEPTSFSYSVVDSNYRVNRILASINNKLLFDGSLQGSLDNELYSFDLITRTISLVKDINPGTNSSNITSNFYAQGITKFYFIADNGTGAEPWVSDGTTTGTYLIGSLSGTGNTSMSNQFGITGAWKNSVCYLSGDTLHTNYDSDDMGIGYRYYITDGNSLWLTSVAGGYECPGFWEPFNGDVYFSISYMNATAYRIYKFSDYNVITSTINYGISNIKKETLLYPNPSNGKVTINLEKEYKNIATNVIDLQGKLVYSSLANETNLISIDFEAPSGLYFISIVADETNFNLKMIKQ